MNKIRHFVLVLALLQAADCLAQSPVFDLAHFGDVSSFALQADAAIVQQELRLASKGSEKAGAAWYNLKQGVAGGFETDFGFKLSAAGEGFAFVVQANPLPALGEGRGGLGFAGTPNSVAVEFDVRQDELVDDFASPHLSVQTRGTLPNNADRAFSLGSATGGVPPWGDGQLHRARIVYQPGTLDIFLDDALTPTLSVSIDLETKLSLDRGSAWIGLAAASGASQQQLSIIDWSFALASTPVSTRIPTPLSGAGYVAPAVIQIAATADSVGSTITRVELYAGATKIAELTNAPYEFIWSDVPPGEYLLTAWAVDELNRHGISAPVPVVVHPAIPPVAVNIISAPSGSNYLVSLDGQAGVVAQRHWNNLPAFTNGLVLALSLLDGGANPLPIQVELEGAGIGEQKVVDPTISADHALMKAFVKADGPTAAVPHTTTLALSPIPFPVYDLIIYSDGDNGRAESVTEFRIGTKTNVLRDAAGVSFAGIYAQANGKVDAGVNTPVGNYVRFNGLSSNNLVVAITRRSSTDGIGRAPINGFQIIPSIYDSTVPPTVSRGPYLQNGSTTNVTVRWRTNRPLHGQVHYGTNQTNLEWTVDGLPGAIEQSATLTGLLPDTRYYYSVGTTNSTLAGGADYYFVTAPAVPKPTRIWAIGDSGTANNNARAVRDAYLNLAGSRYTDVWLMLGDNAYNSGTDAEFQGAVFDMYPTILRQSVLWSTIGNHETAQSHNPPLSIPYFNIFTFPVQGEAGGEPSGTERYYSFDYGDIHFVVVDSMTSDRSPQGIMATWLRADLEANTRHWIIALFHHPPYTKGSHDSDDPNGRDFELVEMRENIVPILESYGTDLVLSGHSHCYERSYLLRGHYGYSTSFLPEMKVDPGSGREDDTGVYVKSSQNGAPAEGTVYIVAGSSGQISQGTFDHPAMYFSRRNLGSLVVDIDGNVLQARFLRETGAFDDYFTIVKSTTSEGQVLRLTSVHKAAEEVDLHWEATVGKTYQIERTTDLARPDWRPISGNITATTAVMVWRAPAADGGATAYYRVVCPQ